MAKAVTAELPDPSVIKLFTLPNDNNQYVMIDADVLAQIKDGLTASQASTIDSYAWVPSQADFDNGAPMWAGNDPPAIYFKIPGTNAQKQARLAAALVKFIHPYYVAIEP